jgi:hypothetical protein
MSFDDSLRLVRRLLPLLAVVLLGACRSTTLEIQSTTTWAGSYKIGDNGPNNPISGTGDASIEVDSDVFCWTVQKQTELGRLRVFAKVPNWFGSDHGGIKDTLEPFGVASGCSYD